MVSLRPFRIVSSDNQDPSILHPREVLDTDTFIDIHIQPNEFFSKNRVKNYITVNISCECK